MSLARWLPQADEPIDRARMLEMRDQCGDLITQLIEIFAETTPEALARLESALEDPETIRGVAHSLKGACQNVGATAMADLCRALENDPAAATTHVPRLWAAVEPTLAALRGVIASEAEAADSPLQ